METNQSRAKLVLLKLQIEFTKKEGLSMLAYFSKMKKIVAYYSKMKEIADNHKMAGSPVTNDLQILPLQYDGFIANIISHPMLLGVEEVQALL